MKPIKTIMMLAFLGLMLACSYNELPAELAPDLMEEARLVVDVETRAETYQGKSLNQDYFVSAEDLNNFVKFRRSESKRNGLSVKEVKSYGFDSSHTLFYILNYDQGWEVVSADKRIPPTLAYGDSGEFTMDCDNEAMKYWMNLLADGVLQIRLCNDVVTTASTEKASTAEVGSRPEDYVGFWETISPSATATRAGGLTPIIGPVTPLNYVYQVDTEIVEGLTTTYGPYLVTAWTQESPWNMYCPLKTDGTGDRAPVGCVAVSGAQMIYYLQDFYDLIAYAPVDCFYGGNIDDPFVFFTFFETEVWDNMALYDGDALNAGKIYEYSAMLMRYAGDLMDMDYGNAGSSASTMRLKEDFFSEFDITCSEAESYSINTIVENLEEGLPVIIRAEDEPSGGGHSWIIDGYHRQYKEITNYYVSYPEPKSDVFLALLDKDDAHYSRTTTIVTSSTMHMNWGWPNSNGNYSTTPSTWEFWNGSESYTYDSDIKMVYNFSPIN